MLEELLAAEELIIDPMQVWAQLELTAWRWRLR
jgi:hypothetical protein